MKPPPVLARSFRAASACSAVSRRALQRQIERQRVPVGQWLCSEHARIDQSVDDARAHPRRLCEARLDPDEPVLRDLHHARPGRGHALGRRPYEPHAVARRRRRESAARAHHHAQHHAGGGQRVARDPIGEVERDRRERRHILDHFDDLAELLAVDLRLARIAADAATQRRGIPRCRAVRPRTGRARPRRLRAEGSRKAQAERAAEVREPSAARRPVQLSAWSSSWPRALADLTEG